MMMSQLYFFVPKHNGRVCTPYVLIVLPLAATGEEPGCLVLVSNHAAGKTLISAPVPTKNRLRDVLSLMNSKPSLGHANLTACLVSLPAYFGGAVPIFSLFITRLPGVEDSHFLLGVGGSAASYFV